MEDPNHTPLSPGVPLKLSSFIGREEEAAQLLPMIIIHRLVTLTGRGGAGKTRLAFDVARRLALPFDDGVRTVELASLTDAVLVPKAVAQGLGLQEQPDVPLLETLIAYLDGRELLLILDNCEHLVEECAGFQGGTVTADARWQMMAMPTNANRCLFR